MLDESTRKEIDKLVGRVLKEASLKNPPISIEAILDHLNIYRDFYNLEDPGFLRKMQHKINILGTKLAKIARKIHLDAVWLPDRKHILVDSSLPPPKQKWASFHDVTHSILPSHKIYFLGDTAQTLDPDFQMVLEAEAHYGGSALMFGGKLFTKEALDTNPQWASIEILAKRYATSYPTTLRRYVQFSHDLAMVLLVTTPWWLPIPDGQEYPWRHFVRSKRFEAEFGQITPRELWEEINEKTTKRRGGPVGDYGLSLLDLNGSPHEFHAESFFNRYYLLTLIVHQKGSTTRSIIIPNRKIFAAIKRKIIF